MQKKSQPKFYLLSTLTKKILTKKINKNWPKGKTSNVTLNKSFLFFGFEKTTTSWPSTCFCPFFPVKNPRKWYWFFFLTDIFFRQNYRLDLFFWDHNWQSWTFRAQFIAQKCAFCSFCWFSDRPKVLKSTISTDFFVEDHTRSSAKPPVWFHPPGHRRKVFNRKTKITRKLPVLTTRLDQR